MDEERDRVSKAKSCLLVALIVLRIFLEHEPSRPDISYAYDLILEAAEAAFPEVLDDLQRAFQGVEHGRAIRQA